MITRIRRVVPEDAAALAELLRDIGWFATLNDKPIETVTAQIELQIAQCLADNSHSIYVAESSVGKIAGYTSVHWLPYLFMAGPEGYVSELFVHSNARGQGIGDELMRAVEVDARARGCSRLSLVNLRHRESYLRKFYIKAGWEERPEAANFLYRIA
ncbi:MAG TPA: GNAT family N-acetyltransferase [Candidatus Binatia bacterium]|nr:GNAT family N-acetyltransferase [Candidatus Binatia bacterium]